MAEEGDHLYTTKFESVLIAEQAAIAKRRGSRRPIDDSPIGVALSGGGIRSASICLGVLQALDSRECLDGIDYLSTVSGGGYIGCCLTASMNAAAGKPHINEADRGYGDTAAIRHIRDFSNYLIPRGFGDVVTALGLIGRGLVANALLISPFFILSILLLLSWLKLDEYFPQPDQPKSVAERIWRVLPLTIALSAVLVALLGAWAFSKTLKTKDTIGDDAELTGRFVVAWKFVLGAVALSIWLELQPLALAVVRDPRPDLLASCFWKPDFGSCMQTMAATWLKVATPLLAPVAAIVGFLSRTLGLLTSQRKGLRADNLIKRAAAKTLLWGAAIVVPSLLWLLYLLVTAELAQWHQPFWAFAGLVAGLLLSLLAVYFIDPNATSLHRFYRDRLGKAFLFDPDKHKCDAEGNRPSFFPRLQNLDPKLSPYPIINAALNIEGSPFANKRGRDADFFEFTPDYVGSEATGWIRARKAEEIEPKLDLATAMAISGAAVSPNMGSATIRPLVPTLALLNVRLGFWLRNPKHMEKTLPVWTRSSVYLYREIVSNITEESYKVYLTDGGNIENLGVHALLRRRCKLIIAIDAEADPAFTFGAYLKLQRYARIDFGVLLDLPWQAIRDQSLAVNKSIAAKAPMSSNGPHVAIGTIRYGLEKTGILVYIKSSLSGDEADYILDYKTRHMDFPHETTGDQFFGEEQLEVYRALGFHIMRHFLEGDVPVVGLAKPGESALEAGLRLREKALDVLGLSRKQ